MNFGDRLNRLEQFARDRDPPGCEKLLLVQYFSARCRDDDAATDAARRDLARVRHPSGLTKFLIGRAGDGGAS